MLTSRTLHFVLCCSVSLLLTLHPQAAAESLTWTQLSPATAPSARGYAAMAYDMAHKKVVLFGGYDAHSYLQDTWTYDGTTWTKVETANAPAARVNAQMAYDYQTRRIVLFGGYNGTYLGDTWIWDGATSSWTQATPAHSPKAVTGPMVFTDMNGRVDEFGGFDGQFYQLTMWQWSGENWRKVNAPTVPWARSSSAVALNHVDRQIVLWGGLGDVNVLNTWTYDGSTWTLQTPAMQPLTVYGASAVFAPNLGTVVLFGGADGGVPQSRTWSWTGSNWVELFPTLSPAAREGAGMVYDPALRRIVLFGGQSGRSYFGDTWELTR